MTKTFPNHMHPLEARIVDEILRRALTIGFEVRIFDCEEWGTRWTKDIDEIRPEVAATDETYIYLRMKDENGEIVVDNGQRMIGFIWLVHGNGGDVVCDLTDKPSIAALIPEDNFIGLVEDADGLGGGHTL